MGWTQQCETLDSIVWCQTTWPARKCAPTTSSGGGGDGWSGPRLQPWERGAWSRQKGGGAVSLTGRGPLSDTRHPRRVRSLAGKTHGLMMLPPPKGPGSFFSLLAM